ncbi:hypothetical protein PV326_009724, partial [Microctonus aethiopoides]
MQYNATAFSKESNKLKQLTIYVITSDMNNMLNDHENSENDSDSGVVGEHLETIMNFDKELFQDGHTRDVPNLKTLHKLNSDEACSKRLSQYHRE